MGKSLKFLIPLGLFGVLVALLFFGLTTDPSKVPSPLIGKPAPEFSLPALGDPARTISRADLLGKVSLLNVWASWCHSCRAEHTQLMRLARELKEVQILGLNWKDTEEDAKQMLKTSGNPYRVSAFDPTTRRASTGASMARRRPSWSMARAGFVSKKLVPSHLEPGRRKWPPPST